MLVSGHISKTQDITLHGRPYGDSIALRWQVWDHKAWEKGFNGYDLYRKSRGGDFVKITGQSVLPLSYDDSEKLLETSDDSLVASALTLLYGDQNGIEFPESTDDDQFAYNNDPLEIRWMYHFISCTYSPLAAKLSGLMYTDQSVVKGEKYTYRLTYTGSMESLAEITIGPSDPYKLAGPDSLADFTHKGSSMLSWKLIETPALFVPWYHVYRSKSKTKGYEKMTDLPILNLTKSEWMDSTRGYYLDTTLSKKETYYYKVRGKDLFDEWTPYSEPHLVTEKTFMRNAPYFERWELDNESRVELEWVIPFDEKENVKIFSVYHSVMKDSTFKQLGKAMNAKKSEFRHDDPAQNNYYKLLTVGAAGDSIWSSVVYVHVADSIPPNAPKLVSGISDTNAVVTLKWLKNTEKDLKGYRVYRANYANEEFSRVGTINSLDTIFKDTIEINNLANNIYYKITAFDNSFNPSDFSNVVKVRKPDIIPPMNPVFTKFKSMKEGIRLEWANSPSKDVARQIVIRRLLGTEEWLVNKVNSGDSLWSKSYIDRSVEPGTTYEYSIIAVDSSDLKSDFCLPLTIKAYDDGFRDEIMNFNGIVSQKASKVKLQWDYDRTEVDHFVIYKGMGEARLAAYKSVEGFKLEFIDKDLKPKKIYKYRVKAVFKDGGSSPFSEEVTIEF